MASAHRDDKVSRPRRAWTAPRIRLADVKDLTRGGQGSGPDGGLQLGMAMQSDARVKRDVIACGHTPGGVPMFAFRYVWGGPVHVGTIAQELAAFRPDAVRSDALGIAWVDYAQLDVETDVIPA